LIKQIPGGYRIYKEARPLGDVKVCGEPEAAVWLEPIDTKITIEELTYCMKMCGVVALSLNQPVMMHGQSTLWSSEVEKSTVNDIEPENK
jgi:hypothetical protein